MDKCRIASLFIVTSVITTAASRSLAAEVKIDSGTFGGLEARAIGPAVMGGRIAALDAVYKDRLTIYVGAAAGGVWKSANAGTSFKPVFEKYPQSIGAISIDRTKPDVVWVGTGEPWTRNSVSIGNGIYKTTDGGDNWEHLGLADTERISRIIIDPKNSDTVYVCAPGHLWNSNEERGLFKTTDGGKSWTKMLYIDADTGCGDVAIDPQDPNIVYATTWQFRRWAYFFKSGGPGSGLHKSIDGGKTWRKITQGLPSSELGRIAIAVAPTRPSVLYASVESEKTGMYRSDDLGESWRWTGTSSNVEARPFYFSLVVPDPADFNRVYKPGGIIASSTDGGQTFSSLGNGTHGDHHALWIDPHNADHMLLGTDGGIYRSFNRGVHWEFLQVLPVSQFYEVAYDMADPYNVYGGLQDNGTWKGPSRTPSGVRNKHWNNIGGGDGFAVQIDKRDPDLVYVEWQGGRVQRRRMSTGEMKDIKPLPGKDDPKYRFNWNTPIALSPTRDDTVYLGGQFLFRTRDRGESWERISPDLTTDDPEKQKQIDSGGLTPDNSTAENHCTIYTISESPKNESVIWVGTDDGNLQITRDGGKTWKNVVSNVTGLTKNTWVSHVEASRFAEGTAYVTFDGHTSGDMKPYVYKTADFGQTWTALATDAVEGFCHVIREDLESANLLFLGTELGLFVSVDGGAQWARFEGNVPKVPVRDLAIHPREHDLIIATHGRGILIVDDIAPLRQFTQDVLEDDVAMLKSRPSVLRIPAGEQEFPGDDEYFGPNPPDAVQITYYLKNRHMVGDLKLEVLDANGKVISTLPGTKRRGLNRVSWMARQKPPKIPPASTLVPQMFAFLGPQIAEGTYKVRLTKVDKVYEGAVAVLTDPRADYTAEGKALQDKLVMELYDLLGRLTFMVDGMLDLETKVKERIEKAGTGAPVAARLKEFGDSIEALRKTIVATRKGGFLAGEERLREKLGDLYGAVNGYEGSPTKSQVDYAKVLAAQLDEANQKVDAAAGVPLDALNAALTAAGQEPIARLTKAEWDAKQAGQ